MNTNRPSTKSQSSRKGKKAWRKNIDLDHLEQDIEDRRDAEIVLGPTPLFEVDTAGHDDELTQGMKQEKQLKSHQILYKRSAVPGLLNTHKRKETKKPKVKVHQLARKVGRTGEEVSKVRIEQDGINRANDIDLWGTEVAPIPVKRHIKENPHAPVPSEEHVALPHAGKSYNPREVEWKALISDEHKKLEKIEEERELVEAEKVRIQALIEKFEQQEDEEEEESESEQEVFDGKLSVNAAVVNKKKSKQQRAKELRHKNYMQLQQRLKDLKKQAAEIDKIQIDDLKLLEPNAPRPKKPKTLKGKHKVIEAPIEVKLSDEIEDSLRRLRPEGNIALDRFRNLQARGLIEARIPTKRRRRYPKVVTEKYSFKHFNKGRVHGE